jgi:hypothetical protein
MYNLYSFTHLFVYSDDAIFRAHLLRFLSTLILYGAYYLNLKDTKYTSAILSDYCDMNSKGNTVRPKVVAGYTGLRMPKRQKQLYSNLLQSKYLSKIQID